MSVPTIDSDEGVLDPWVADWISEYGAMMEQPDEPSPEYLAAARMPTCPFPTRDIAKVTDEVVAGVPIRIYEHDTESTGVLVYFHGGGFCTGSIGLMENVATELAVCTGATVISVEYRLAPEHPYPAGLEDCEAVTRWALANASRFRASPTGVVVAGESAGGNLAAAVALHLRDTGGPALAAQVLLYPGLDNASTDHPSRRECEVFAPKPEAFNRLWAQYSAGQDLDIDPYAAPLQAKTVAGLPPAFVLLGGADWLRDEGRAYARRLRDEGVAVEEHTCAGQPHGFLNLGFPAAADAYERIGSWVRAVLAAG